jgi:predicted subunit of tRNA(5-methylaminomethyl-2-thiouridylate) methyltransferase
MGFLKNYHIIAKLMIKEFTAEVTNVSEQKIMFIHRKGHTTKNILTYIAKLILDNKSPSLSLFLHHFRVLNLMKHKFNSNLLPNQTRKDEYKFQVDLDQISKEP